MERIPLDYDRITTSPLAYNYLHLNQLISLISADFVCIQDEHFDSIVNHALSVLGSFLSADRVFVFIYDFESKTFKNTYEWNAHNLYDNSNQTTPIHPIHQWHEQDWDKETFYIADVSDIPEDNSIRKDLENQGIQSVMIFPMKKNDHCFGYLEFDLTEKIHLSSDSEQKQLSEFTAILLGAIQHRQFDHQQEQSLGLLESVLNTQSELICCFDFDSMLTYVNDSFANKTQKSKSELIGSSILKLMPPDFQPFIAKLIQYGKTQTKAFRYEAKSLDSQGNVVWIDFDVFVIDTGKPLPEFQLVGRDQTLIHKAESKDLKEKIRLQNCINAAKIGIWEWDIQKDNLIVNDGWAELLGYSLNELNPSPKSFLVTCIHPDHRNEILDQIQNTIANPNKFFEGEFKILHKNGQYIWVQYKGKVINWSEDGSPILMYGTMIDITQKKEYENTLENAKIELEAEISRQTLEIAKSQIASSMSLARLTEARDHETGKHIDRVQINCRLIAEQMRVIIKYRSLITASYLNIIYYASALHDIGKVGIPDRILMKPGKLSRNEFEIMKTHVLIGSRTLEDISHIYPNNKITEMGIDIAKYHHEKWDGTGYPLGLKGEDIPLSARIMALVDTYDALRSRRPYKESLSREIAFKIVCEESGKHFDPEIVDAFIVLEAEFDIIFTNMSGN
jgi:PAS domain S-box-containing protein